MDYDTRLADGRMNIALKGRLSFSDNEVFHRVVKEIEAANARQIVIDLSRLEFMDSAGLGMLLIARETCQQARASLSVEGAAGQVKQIMDISDFEELLRT